MTRPGTPAETPERQPRIPLTMGWGVALAAMTALISGVSIYVNGFAVKQLPDAAVYTTVKNGVAAAILITLAAAVVPRAGVRAIDRRAWTRMGVIGVVGGSVPFLLFFSGLAIASAPTAAFVHKTLFVWVVLLAVPFLGERLGWFPIAALGVLLAGQVLAAPPTGVSWGTGETMILAATLLWAVEVVLARRLLLRDVPSPVLGAARLGIGVLVLVGYLAVTGRFAVVVGLTATQWAWALATGVLLAAYVGTWLAALRRAPASVVASVLVLGAPVTALIAWLAGGALPAPPVLVGQAVITLAVGAIVVLAVRSGRSGRIARTGTPVPA
jgi:drug/metabolite transporter (DMT)-like permease